MKPAVLFVLLLGHYAAAQDRESILGQTQLRAMVGANLNNFRDPTIVTIPGATPTENTLASKRPRWEIVTVYHKPHLIRGTETQLIYEKHIVSVAGHYSKLYGFGFSVKIKSR